MKYGIPYSQLEKRPIWKEGYWVWQSSYEGAFDKENMLVSYIFKKLPWYLTHHKDSLSLKAYFTTRKKAIRAMKIAMKKHLKNEIKDIK